jgi:hypothetical protein
MVGVEILQPFFLLKIETCGQLSSGKQTNFVQIIFNFLYKLNNF